MEKVKTTPDGQESNRFSDMTGYIIKPGEPPTWADAMSNLWAAYWYAEPGADKEVPSGETIQAELERLTALDAEGLWDRDTRREIRRYMPEEINLTGQGRFSDISGWIIKPGEPANIADAHAYAWAEYWYSDEEKEIPGRERIQQWLTYLQQLDAEGKFDRENRVVIDESTDTEAEQVQDA